MIIENSRYNLVFISIFFIILLAPLSDNILKISKNLRIELNENRIPEKFPSVRRSNGEISGSLLKKFPKKFENYYNDNFGFRDPILYLSKKSGLQQLSINKKYIKGLDNWLFLTQENSLKNSIGSNLLNIRQLKNIYKKLINNWDLCKKRKIAYIFVVAPSKYSIYPEFLPKFISDIYIKKENITTNTDQILNYILSSSPDFPILDLRKPLLVAKNNSKNHLYYKTDTHWNGLGIETGYNEVKNFLKSRYKIQLNTPKYQISEIEFEGGDLSEMSGIEHKYLTHLIYAKDNSKLIKAIKEERYDIEFFKNNNPKETRSILVQHDSFFDHDMKKLIKNSFQRTSFIHKYSTCELSKKDLLLSKASIVAQEMVERTFINCKNN